MAHVGYLKVALHKTSKNDKPFLSLLVLKTPEDEEGQWMTLWDTEYHGIADFASDDEPPKVVYEAKESNGFVTCTRIRLDSEAEQEAIHEAVESVAKPTGDTEALKNAIDLAEIGVEQAQLGIARAKEALAELVPF